MAAFTERYQKRIKHDLTELYADPVDGIFVVQDESQNNRVHALIIGPKDTPYDGGFFYFLFTYPEKYPLKPPAVKFMTTGNGKVRFNPNLYACGKVCLSILGTWTGPEWTSVMTTKSVLISIQSLIMNDNPFFNEPGYERMKTTAQGKPMSEKYNERIRYEKMNVAVIGMMQSCQNDKFAMPHVLKEMAIKIFRENYERYQQMVDTIVTEAAARATAAPPPEKSASPFHYEYLAPRDGRDSDYSTLKSRLDAVYAEITSSKRDDCFAEQLYDSLREAYTGSRRARSETLQMVEDITNGVSDSDDDCVVLDSSESDEDVQVLPAEASPSKQPKDQPSKRE